MGMDDVQVAFSDSYLKAMPIAEDRGHIVVDFPVREIPLERRRAVNADYRKNNFAAEFQDYVAIAIIVATGEKLIVPPNYARCSIAQKTAPKSKPPIDHVNHADFVKLINGDSHA